MMIHISGNLQRIWRRVGLVYRSCVVVDFAIRQRETIGAQVQATEKNL